MMENLSVAVTETPYVERNFIWRIQKFVFPTGKSISDPISTRFILGARSGEMSTWELILTSLGAVEQSPRHTDLHLKVVRSPGSTGGKGFHLQAIVKNGAVPNLNETVLVTQTMPSKQFTIFGNLLTVTVGDQLEIHVKFEWYLPKTLYSSWSIGIPPAEDGGPRPGHAALLNTSDVLVKVKGEHEEWTKIKLHKAFVGEGIEFFQRLLNTGMVTTNAVAAVLVEEELGLDCMRILIQFIYMNRLRDYWKNVAAELVVASNKFDVPELRNFLDTNLITVCTARNFEKLRGLAKTYGLKTAYNEITEFVFENIDDIF